MYVNVCFQSRQSHNEICLFPMCESVSDCCRRQLGLGSPLAVGQSPSLSHGWVCDFFTIKKCGLVNQLQLVLIWYWFVNFLHLNLFCNFLIKNATSLKKYCHCFVSHVSNTTNSSW